jgi:chemotaxis protein MotA
LEISTGLGLLLGFGALIVSVILEGGTPASLLNTPAAVIVFGGTFGATLISFPLSRFLKLPSLIALSFKSQTNEMRPLIELFVSLADHARREGLLSLEEEANSIEDQFVKKGVMLIVDGVDPETVRTILETDAHLAEGRHKDGYGMLEAMAGFGPTMGIIGTVMGLINVLSRLADPENLGHSIAVAFIATLYGVASANLLWLPIGNKLKNNSMVENRARELAIEGILAVQAGENPRIVRDKLESFLPPKERGQEAAKASQES